MNRIIENLRADLPVGVFDSGVGGLTVAREIAAVLPHENIDYIGDTARVPYGNRDTQTIRRYARECADTLVRRGIKALVIACNTATAHALSDLEQRFPELIVVGVIRPVATVAARSSLRIGVIGTRATVASNAYLHALHAENPDISVTQIACPLFVPLVEEGWCHKKIAYDIAEEYLAPLRHTVDTLILGCTHYPLMRHVIAASLPGISLCDNARATALELQHKLVAKQLLNNGNTPRKFSCFVTGDPVSFDNNARAIGIPIESVEKISVFSPESIVF